VMKMSEELLENMEYGLKEINNLKERGWME
jgi:hypothetical protein